MDKNKSNTPPMVDANDILLITGPPGAGKGTQTPNLENLGWPVISTGALLRQEIATKSKLGQLADKLLRDGNLFPDDLTLQLLAKQLPKTRCVLDGYPRTTSQANDLDKLLHLQNRKVARVLYLDASDKTITKRILLRRTCNDCSAPQLPIYDKDVCPVCNGEMVKRVDDNPQTILKRLDIYHNQTAKILPHYQDRIIYLNAELPVDILSALITSELKKLN